MKGEVGLRTKRTGRVKDVRKKKDWNDCLLLKEQISRKKM